MPSLATRRVWAIVPAAGRGARFSASTPASAPKQYAPLHGATVLEWSLRALLAEPRVHAVVVALAADDAEWPRIAAKIASPKIQTTLGGTNRQDSVANGLEYLAAQAAADDWVLVHDAARPCLNAADLRALLDAVHTAPGGSGAAAAAGAASTASAVGAVLAAPIVDTVKRELGGHITTVDRAGLWRALTPQVFAFAQLRHALKEAAAAGISVTDEAQAIERMGLHPLLVPGSPFNVKITQATDLSIAAGVLKMTEDRPMRIGQGFDVHAFGAGDHVMLGGVKIAHSNGVVAHSDGDVVIHALCDAVLGALGDGDIGRHFPDSDPQYRGADSRVFLRAVAARMRAAGLTLINADITVLAEAPRIAAHRAAMAAALSADLGAAAHLINIKATTTERLGFIGRGEGLAALASVLLGAGSLSEHSA
jgi:2-C-methyl-D-erythritol 4-phosphate cytidylyltransferase/2-C-methyl-D-erythritol 2,4-cyclodiphosphate synthase